MYLSPQDAKEARKLVRRLCCNYKEGCCLLLDNGEPQECPQRCSHSIICKWFYQAVLPQDKDLYIRLTMPPKTKACEKCGSFFMYKSRKARYCPDCKKKVEHIQALERKLRQRHKTKNG